MFDYVTNAIVRILDAEQKPVGAGCLVRDKLIVTCAHVLADALEISRDAPQAPARPLTVDFPFVPSTVGTARVVLWWPYRQTIGGERRHDLAVVELEDAPSTVEPARLLRPGHEQPAPIYVYGFPNDAGLGDLGDWIEGRLTPPLPNGWLKLVRREQQARFIEPGCSGGPVVIEDGGLVAGLVSLRRSDTGAPEAYGISATLIREALAEVRLAARRTGAAPAIAETSRDLRQAPTPQKPSKRETPKALPVIQDHEALPVIQDHPLAPQLVMVPRGEFLMGSAEGDRDALEREKPQHRVRIAYELAIGRAAVTFEEWDRYAADVAWHAARQIEPYRPHDASWGRGSRPVINVSWDDIQEYLRWLSAKTGQRYGLPSEAQWEYACRAGTTTAFYFGSTITHADANFGRKIGRTTGVLSYAPNAWGLYNMHGNVSEWCEDCWNDSYRGATQQGLPKWTGDCGRRVVRGGSWNLVPNGLRSATRVGVSTDTRDPSIGFRVARVRLEFIPLYPLRSLLGAEPPLPWLARGREIPAQPELPTRRPRPSMCWSP